MFSFSVDTRKKGSDRFTMTKQVLDSKGHERTIKDKLSPTARNMFDTWQANAYFDQMELEDRQKLWEDMDRAYFNSAIIGKAVKLTADEIIQADMNTLPIGVEAPRKQKKFILDLFDRLGIYSKLHQLAEDIVLYGNAGWMLGFDSRGVTDITPIDVYDIVKRIEFNAREVSKQLKSQGSMLNQMLSYQRMDALIKSIQNSEAYNADFKNYLFGYQIAEQFISPWRFIHFRNATSKSPFRPFGLPMYINSIAPYRQYDACLSLQVAARGARFPIDRYSLNMPMQLNPNTMLERVLDFVSQLENSGIRGIPKEGIGIGERMVTIKDLFDFDQITPQIDIGKIDDLDLLKEDLIESTDIPANFFIAGKEGWGSSGISLTQQYKPFARRVYRGQMIIQEGLSQLVKIAMIQSNQFSLEEIDFVLTMPYPESQVSPEIITSQNDLLSLANTVLDSIADKIFGGSAQELPIEVVRQVYHQILPYDQSRIDGWINTAQKDRDKMNREMDKQAKDVMQKGQPEEIDYDDKNANDFGYAGKGHSFKVKRTESYKKMIEKAGGNTSFSNILKESIHEARQETFREWSSGGKHHFSSKNRVDVDGFPAERLVELDKERVSRLKNVLKEDTTEALQEFNKQYNESVKVKYKFKSKYSRNKEERKRQIIKERVDEIKRLARMAATKSEEIMEEEGLL
jgi:hypothetical protein